MKLVQGRELGCLVKALIEALARESADPVKALFERKIVVVPNAIIRSYVLQAIATSELGAAFHVKTPSLDSLLFEIDDKALESVNVINHGSLRAAIIGLLLQTPKKVSLPPAVAAYLDPPDGVNGADRRAYQLADRLASTFVSYGDESPEVIDAWNQGKGVATHPDGKALEEWERSLWRLLWAKDGPFPGKWFWPRDAWTKALGACTSVPAHVHVFGFTQIGRTHAEVLKALGEKASVHLYIRSPSGIDPAGPYADITEELLTSWSAVHRRTLGLLSPHVNERELRDTDGAGGASVLTTFQKLITAPTARSNAPKPLRPDGSVKVFVNHGIQRECEAISDEIWRLMVENDQKPGTETLRFSDIAVLVANKSLATSYTAELQAACFDNHGIPLNTGAMSKSGEGSVAEGALALLDLPLCGFTRSKMLAFLAHPLVSRKFGVKPELWTRIVESAGIFRGADREAQRDTYVKGDLHNWDQGVRRLALGDLVAEAAPDEPLPVKLDGEIYHPLHNVSRFDGDPVKALLPIRALIADVEALETGVLSLADWGKKFASMVEAYVCSKGDEAREHQYIVRCLRDLGEGTDERLMIPISAGVATARDAVLGGDRFRGHLLAHGVHVAPLRPGESLPFKAVFICGLAADVFPATVRVHELDVREGALLPPSSRDLDLAAFLEAVSSTRQQLVLSHVAWGEGSGAEKVQSAPVRLLRAYLEKHILAPDSGKELEVEHFLRRYADGYTMAGSIAPAAQATATRVSFSPEAGREFVARLGKGDAAAPAAAAPEPISLTPSRPMVHSVDLKVMLEFLKDPLQAWGKHVLELTEGKYQVSSPMTDDEPLDVPGWTFYVMVPKVFEDAVIACKKQKRPSEKLLNELLKQEFAALEAAGTGPTGDFREVLEKSFFMTLKGWAKSYELKELSRFAPYKRVRLGKARTAADADEARRPLDLDLGGSQRALLSGEIALVSEDETVVIGTANRKEPNITDLAKPYLDTLALVASSPAAGKRDMIFACLSNEGLDAEGRSLDKLSPADALAQLAAIAHDLLLQSHAYILPIYQVHEFWMNSYGKTFAEKIAGFPPWSRGPVRNPLQYQAPADDVVETVIEQRLLRLFDATILKRSR